MKNVLSALSRTLAYKSILRPQHFRPEAKSLITGLLIFAQAGFAHGAPIVSSRNLIIPLETGTRIDRQTGVYQCTPRDKTRQQRPKPLLKTPLRVQYINAGEIHLALIKVQDHMQVFTNVLSADGGKYAAEQYVWWTKGDEATFDNTLDDGSALTCRDVAAPK